MSKARVFAVIVALAIGVATGIVVAQGQAPAPQVVYNLQGLPPGMHGAHIHTVGRCDPPAFASAGGHFDPGPAGNTDPDLNHPFHSGDLPNVVANAAGEVASRATRHVSILEDRCRQSTPTAPQSSSIRIRTPIRPVPKVRVSEAATRSRAA